MSKKEQKYNISDEGRKTRQRVGSQNLAAWQKENPAGGRLSHGATSKTIRKRYSDRRTREGRALAEILDGLVDDLGGPAALSTGHQVILSSIKSKLIIVMQIGKYTDKAESIIDSEGNLLPALRNSYLGYTESLRRDLEALFGIKRKQAKESYEKALRLLQGGA